MMARKSALTLVPILSLLASVPIHAADSSGSSINTPNNDAYTTAPVDNTVAPARKKHSGSSKTRKKDSKVDASAPVPTDHAATTPPPSGAIASPGVPGNIYGNDAGMANKGTGDHTPGTTGTSGQ